VVRGLPRSKGSEEYGNVKEKRLGKKKGSGILEQRGGRGKVFAKIAACLGDKLSDEAKGGAAHVEMNPTVSRV